MRRRWRSEPCVQRFCEVDRNWPKLLVSSVDEKCCSCGCGHVMEELSSSGIDSGTCSDNNTLIRSDDDHNRITIFVPFDPSTIEGQPTSNEVFVVGSQKVVLTLGKEDNDDDNGVIIEAHNKDFDRTNDKYDGEKEIEDNIGGTIDNCNDKRNKEDKKRNGNNNDVNESNNDVYESNNDVNESNNCNKDNGARLPKAKDTDNNCTRNTSDNIESKDKDEIAFNKGHSNEANHLMNDSSNDIIVSRPVQRRRLKRRMARRLTTAITRRSLDSILIHNDENDEEGSDKNDKFLEKDKNDGNEAESDKSEREGKFKGKRWNEDGLAVKDDDSKFAPFRDNNVNSNNDENDNNENSNNDENDNKDDNNDKHHTKDDKLTATPMKTSSLSHVTEENELAIVVPRRKDLTKWLGIDNNDNNKNNNNNNNDVNKSNGLSVPVVRWARKLTISSSLSSSRHAEVSSYRDLDELRHENVKQVLRLGRGQHRKDLHRFLGLDDSDSDEMVFIHNHKNKSNQSSNNAFNQDVPQNHGFEGESDSTTSNVTAINDTNQDEAVKSESTASSLSSLDEATVRTSLDAFLKMHLINNGNQSIRQRGRSTPDICVSSTNPSSSTNRSSSSEELKSSLRSPELRSARGKKTVIFSEDTSTRDETSRRLPFWPRQERRRAKKEAERRSAELLLQPHQRRQQRGGHNVFVVDPAVLLVPPQHHDNNNLALATLLLTCDARGRVRLVTPSAAVAAAAQHRRV